MYFDFNANLFVDGRIIDPLNIRVYTRNLNILRFVSGFAGLAWAYG
jgi:hypothetical protein